MRASRTDIRAALLPTIAIALGLLAVLPVANWIPGGHEIRAYASLADAWSGGTALVAASALLLAILSRRIPGLWHPDALDRFVASWEGAPRRAAVITAALALAVYVIVAHVVFDATPIMFDEIAQVLHATALADGRLWLPTPQHPEFFSILNVVDIGERTYSHFPAGGPATLALGMLLGAAWLAVPLCGAVAVVAFASIARRLEPHPRTAMLATLLFAFAPFIVFMSATHMNHVPAMMWLLIGTAGLLRVTASPTPLPWIALASGIGFGAAATIRPADAVVFALPAGVWLLTRALRDRRRWVDALATAAGVGLPVAILLWVNWRTTGAPTRFAYEVLWGSGVNLGFHHAVPWGEPHTPLRGLELLSVYMVGLARSLYETPVPAVLPALIALGLSRRLSAGDRYLLVSGALLLGIYFLYWSSGLYLGPRFIIPLVPALALWTARCLPALRARLGDDLRYRAAAYAWVIALAIAVAWTIPQRAREYTTYNPHSRWNMPTIAESAGVREAVVFVRDSWGAQLNARLWALGVSRPEARRFRLFIDRCLLEGRVTALERANVRDSAAAAALRPLMRDSARIVPVLVGGTHSTATLPGVEYSPDCEAHRREDADDVVDYHPLRVAGGDNIYARDLGARDTLLLEQYPNRAVYLLRARWGDEGFEPYFTALSRDSLWMAWTGHPAPAPADER